jgi:uncharacterized MAPEG superfamily protein
MLPLTPDLTWLTLTPVLTALLWVPYILQLIVQVGLVSALADPTGAHPHEARWAQRAKRAHYNAIENIAVFAPLTILTTALGLNDAMTATVAMLYFWVRLVHYLVYTCALPFVRTLSFVAGVACQLAMAGRVMAFW